MKKITFTLIIVLVFSSFMICLPEVNASDTVNAEMENNDKPSVANQIAINTQMTGNIEYTQDKDWFIFELASPGKISLSVSGTGKKLAIYVIKEMNIKGNDWFTDGDTPFIVDTKETTESEYCRVPAGVYYISVYANENLYKPEEYKFELNYAKEDPALFEQESNDKPSVANKIAVNTQITGNIQYTQEEDWYKFELADQEEVGLTIGSTEKRLGMNIIKDKNIHGNDWFTDGDTPCIDDTVKSTESGSYTLPAGVYYIHVSAKENLDKSVEYKFKINIKNENKDNSPGKLTSIKTAQPAGLKAVILNKKSIKLDWNNVTGAKQYYVYFSTNDSKSYIRIKTLGNTQNTFLCTYNFKEGTTYNFQVCSVDDKGLEGPRSSISKLFDTIPPKLENSDPYKGKFAGTGDEITVKFNETVKIRKSELIQAYDVDRSNSMVAKLNVSLSSDRRTLVISRIKGETWENFNTYKIRVKSGAIEDNNSNYNTSEIVFSFKTGDNPSIPTGIKAVPVDSSRINLTWKTVNSAVSYKVYRSTSSGGTYRLIKTTKTNSYSDTGLESSTVYWYQVSALNSTGEGGRSQPVGMTTGTQVFAAINNPYGKKNDIGNVVKLETGIYGDLYDIVNSMNGTLTIVDNDKQHEQAKVFSFADSRYYFLDYDLSGKKEGSTVNVDIRSDSIKGAVIKQTYGVIHNGTIVANVKDLVKLIGVTDINEAGNYIVAYIRPRDIVKGKEVTLQGSITSTGIAVENIKGKFNDNGLELSMTVYNIRDSKAPTHLDAVLEIFDANGKFCGYKVIDGYRMSNDFKGGISDSIEKIKEASTEKYDYFTDYRNTYNSQRTEITYSDPVVIPEGGSVSFHKGDALAVSINLAKMTLDIVSSSIWDDISEDKELQKGFVEDVFMGPAVALVKDGVIDKDKVVDTLKAQAPDLLLKSVEWFNKKLYGSNKYYTKIANKVIDSIKNKVGKEAFDNIISGATVAVGLTKIYEDIGQVADFVSLAYNMVVCINNESKEKNGDVKRGTYILQVNYDGFAALASK